MMEFINTQLEKSNREKDSIIRGIQQTTINTNLNIKKIEKIIKK